MKLNFYDVYLQHHVLRLLLHFRHYSTSEINVQKNSFSLFFFLCFMQEEKYFLWVFVGSFFFWDLERDDILAGWMEFFFSMSPCKVLTPKNLHGYAGWLFKIQINLGGGDFLKNFSWVKTVEVKDLTPKILS